MEIWFLTTDLQVGSLWEIFVHKSVLAFTE